MNQKTNQSTIDDEALSVDEAVELLIQYVNQLRSEAGIGQDQEISLYVTDVKLLHSALAAKSDYIREQTKAIDIIQVNTEAGNPMPAHIPQIEVHEFDTGPATIGIDAQGEG